MMAIQFNYQVTISLHSIVFSANKNPLQMNFIAFSLRFTPLAQKESTPSQVQEILDRTEFQKNLKDCVPEDRHTEMIERYLHDFVCMVYRPQSADDVEREYEVKTCKHTFAHEQHY